MQRQVARPSCPLCSWHCFEPRHQLLEVIVSGSMKWVLAGIGFGIVGSLGLMRLLRMLLYEVKPTNPAVLGSVAMLLAGVALLASYVPARRAAKVDPMVALRYE